MVWPWTLMPYLVFSFLLVAAFEFDLSISSTMKILCSLLNRAIFSDSMFISIFLVYINPFGTYQGYICMEKSRCGIKLQDMSFKMR